MVAVIHVVVVILEEVVVLGVVSQDCTHCGYSNNFVDYCCDLHGKPFGSANRVSSWEDSLTTSGPLLVRA